MKAPRFDYQKPADLPAALQLLAQAGEAAKVLAGGQSLGPLLNLRLARPKLLVDVRGIEALAASEATAETVSLGACTTHAAIEDGRVPDPSRGMLAHVARGIAYRAVRNRGTLGGSLAHADPAADWVTVMAVLDATVVVHGVRGVREIPAAGFMTGPLSTALAPDELLVAVRVRKLPAGARWSYYKFNRKPGEFADAIAAILVDPDRGVWRVALGVTAGAPHVAETRGPIDGTRAGSLCTDAGFEPGSYEHHVHAVALRRAAAAVA